MMKKLLMIALVAIGSLLMPVQHSDAQITVSVGGVGVGFGYPGYRYGYYPYGGYGYYPYGYYRRIRPTVTILGPHTTTDIVTIVTTVIITTIGTKLT
jgi:hypothetical protein